MRSQVDDWIVLEKLKLARGKPRKNWCNPAEPCEIALPGKSLKNRSERLGEFVNFVAFNDVVF